MGRRIIEERNIRNITRNNSGTYSITIPIEHVRALGWRERQKVIVRRSGTRIIIEDLLPKK